MASPDAALPPYVCPTPKANPKREIALVRLSHFRTAGPGPFKNEAAGRSCVVGTTTEGCTLRSIREITNYFLNVRLAAGIPEVPTKRSGLYAVSGACPADILHASALKADLSKNGRGLTMARRHFYRRLGSRLLIVALEESEGARRVLGVDLFHFEEGARNCKAPDIYEDFIAVSPLARGSGLSKTMRKHAAEWYGRAGLGGIATTIYSTNVPSLRSAQSVGFEIVRQTPSRSSGGVERWRYRLRLPLNVPNETAKA
jgi:GNAT superfamily N-acetyltransferase